MSDPVTDVFHNTADHLGPILLGVGGAALGIGAVSLGLTKGWGVFVNILAGSFREPSSDYYGGDYDGDPDEFAGRY